MHGSTSTTCASAHALDRHHLSGPLDSLGFRAAVQRGAAGAFPDGDHLCCLVDLLHAGFVLVVARGGGGTYSARALGVVRAVPPLSGMHRSGGGWYPVLHAQLRRQHVSATHFQWKTWNHVTWAT